MGKSAGKSLKRLVCRESWPLLVLAIVTVVFLRFLFLSGFPLTHDGENHLARLANLRQAVVDGHLPPRWAPYLNHQFGYPVFHFNYYLPQAIALGFTLLPTVTYETALKMVIISSFGAGGIFVYLWLKEKLGGVPALVAGMIYLAAPYQLANVFVRGNLGEIVAAGLFPGVIWASGRFLAKPTGPRLGAVAVLTAAFLLSHNIAALLGLPLLLGFIAIEWRSRPKRSSAKRLLLAFLLGVGLTQFFWLPALTEKQFTNLDAVSLSSNYYRHFPTFSQLIHSPWGYGFSQPGLVDGLSFELGPFHWLIVVLVVGAVLSQGRKVFKDRFWPWLAAAGFVFWVGIGLMNQASLPLWRLAPVLHYVQFPWRLLLFLLLPLAILAGWLTQRYRLLGIVVAAGALIYGINLAKPQGMFHFDDAYYTGFPFDTSVLSENMPRWFELSKNLDLTQKIFDSQGITTIREIKWKTQLHRYEVDTPREAQIIEHTAYFPGWEVQVDKKPVETEYQLQDYPGLISFSVPAGTHLVEARFTERTLPRILGDTVSLGSVAALGLVVAKRKMKA